MNVDDSTAREGGNSFARAPWKRSHGVRGNTAPRPVASLQANHSREDSGYDQSIQTHFRLQNCTPHRFVAEYSKAQEQAGALKRVDQALLGKLLQTVDLANGRLARPERPGLRQPKGSVGDRLTTQFYFRANLMSIVTVFPVLAVFVISTTAIVTDVKTRRIPNWLTVSGLIAALAFHLISNSWDGLLFSLAGFATGLGLLLPLWLIGGGGGGDVKLMACLGAWLGATLTLITLGLSVILSVGCTLIFMMWRVLAPSPIAAGSAHGPSKTVGSMQSAMRTTVPYAVPAGISAVIIMAAKLLQTGT